MVMPNNMEPGGAGGQPTTPASPSTSAIDVDQMRKVFEPIVTEIVKRETQSVKDKRIAAHEGRLDDFESKLARLEALTQKGMSKDDALWRIKVEDQFANLTGQPTAPASPNGVAGPTPPVTPVPQATTILQAMGLPENDAEVTQVLRETSDIVEQTVKFAQIAQKRKQAQASPTQPNAATLQPSPSGGSVNVTSDTLLAEYQNSIKSIQRGDVEGLFKAKMAIREKARKLGIPEPI